MDGRGVMQVLKGRSEKACVHGARVQSRVPTRGGHNVARAVNNASLPCFSTVPCSCSHLAKYPHTCPCTSPSSLCPAALWRPCALPYPHPALPKQPHTITHWPALHAPHLPPSAPLHIPFFPQHFPCNLTPLPQLPHAPHLPPCAAALRCRWQGEGYGGGLWVEGRQHSLAR